MQTQLYTFKKMKKKHIIFIMIFGFFASCEKDLMTYKSESVLRFTNEKYLLIKSFAFDNTSIVKDTIYLNIKTMGHVFKTDRTFKIEQIKDGKNEKGKKMNNAEAGRHFIDFSNTDFVIKANQTKAKIPIVLLRDISMKKNSFGLKVRIVKNNFFELPEKKYLERLIKISDMLDKPENWYSRGFGIYGTKKHQLMIDASGLKIDKNFFKTLILEVKEYFGQKYIVWDRSKVTYYLNIFKEALKKYNETHPDNPLREEKEKDQIEGIRVSFN
jgi:hypothetical protein